METQEVTFHWYTHHGECYDCGLPAAFYRGETLENASKLCAVCAANYAVDGETIHRIAEEDVNDQI